MKPAVALILFVSTVFGCTRAATPVMPEPATAAVESGSAEDERATKVDLRFDETIAVLGFELLWIDLEDSRCPIGVTCVWAGQTVVTVEVARGEDAVELELLRRADREPETASAYGFDFRLLGVDPHPAEGESPERSSYTAHIEILQGSAKPSAGASV